MESKFKFSPILVISLFALVGFGTMALLVSGNQIVHFDQAMINFIQGLETPILTAIMKFFTFIGAGSTIKVLALITVFVLFLLFKLRFELLLFIVVLIGSSYLFRALKLLFLRSRPDLNRLIEIGGYSFPSGHATNAITFYGILAFILWRHIPSRLGRSILLVFCTIMILSIGLSRIYLGVHYPSDVLGGYFAGGLWLTIAIGLYQFIKEKMAERTPTNA